LKPEANVLFVDFSINVGVGFIIKEFALKEVGIFFNAEQKAVVHLDASIYSSGR
jgi:hypothetical protein